MSLSLPDFLLPSSLVFVTGGSGFLGRQLLKDLVSQGFQVKALARSPQAAKTIQALGTKVVMGDLGDVQAMTEGMRGCAVVIHAAAKVEQWGKWPDFLQMTVQGTKNVIHAAQQAQVQRFIHISTEAVLAGGKAIIDADEHTPIPAVATGFYPLSKRMAEQAVLAANSSDFNTIVVRPRFIWGQGDSTLLPKLVEAVNTGNWLWFGGGEHQMSTCNVKNVSHGVILAARHGRAGQVYFLTDGASVNFRQFITAMMQTQGVTPSTKKAPMWVADVVAAAGETVWKLLHLKGEPPMTRTAVNLFFKQVTVNDSKARRELGYQPILTVKQGLQEFRTYASPRD